MVNQTDFSIPFEVSWSILAHLSHRLKWAFLIKICPLSVVVVIVVVVNFHIFIFFSRTTGSISTKLGTKHLWVKGIQVHSNEGPCSLLRGDNYEIAKIHWQNFKIYFSRTTGPILTKLGTKNSCVKGIQVCSNVGPCPFLRGDNYEIAEIQWILLKKYWANFNQTHYMEHP